MSLKNSSKDIGQYDHKDKDRINNPPIGLVTPDTDIDFPKKQYSYDPHLAPELKWDSQKIRDDWIERLNSAINEPDLEKRKEFLGSLLNGSQQWLQWAGKAEHTTFDVDTVSLHVHERIDPYRIINEAKKKTEQTKLTLFFEEPENNPPLREAIEFYKHKMNWTNRLIAGDSLLVMNSLLEKEGMAGKVQMIYIDPPYGVKYNSNFQPFVNKRDVKDGKDEDLTQEPEMVKAYRDTWELGIHSYLTYLRDRLLLARELLTESGSVFVQISDENVHHVREIMDEVFGKENFVSLISFRKTGGFSSSSLDSVSDYLLWYSKNILKIKYRGLFTTKSGKDIPSIYNWLMQKNGEIRRMMKTELDNPSLIPLDSKILAIDNLSSMGKANESQSYEFREKLYSPPTNSHWKSKYPSGLINLEKCGRLYPIGNSLMYVRFLEDFPVMAIDNIWNDTSAGGFSGIKLYVVQTNLKVIERCILMTTDPGDLVLDPTCGSGTTAYVAEEWGRRWITIDTSRIAIALAKKRLMEPVFDYYNLAHHDEGVGSGFVYETVPHITLKSIANNQEIDIIYDKYHSKIESELNEFNKKLKLSLKEWEVPFEWDKSWNEEARFSFDNFWRLKREMQKEMDGSISKYAPQETLYDKPIIDRSKIRISGPFTVESVPAPVVKPIYEDEKQHRDADDSIAREGKTYRTYQWLSELEKTGVRGKSGEYVEFVDLTVHEGTKYIHGIGEAKNESKRVVVTFGPDYVPMDKKHVENAIHEAQTLAPRPEIIIFASFQFDPEASKDIDETKWSGVTLLKVQMNTDLLTEDLKKKRSSNQSFWLIGQPDVELRKKEGLYQIEVHGFDYYNPSKGTVESGGKEKIAMWMLDYDYDGRSLYPHQVFFPMAGPKDGWSKLAKSLNSEIDEEKIESFRGTVSLPFKVGGNKKIAVKIIDDRGIESLKIMEV